MSVHFRFIDVAEGMPLFAWGAGNHGQLANGLDDHRAPAAVPIEGHIQGLAAGGSHSLIIVNGALFSCGSNEEGQLGVDNKTGAPIDHSDLQCVFSHEFGYTMSTACGWSHSLVLVQLHSGERRLFAFGSNGFSQIALQAAQASVPTVIPTSIDVKIRSVYCGLRHSAFTTTDGAVWLFGENRFAQCGDPSLITVTVPTRLQIPHFIESVALGSRHSVLLTDSGKVLCFGENRFGQCGADPSLIEPISRPIGPNGKLKVIGDIVWQPTEVHLPETRTQKFVRAGWNFSLVWISETQVLHLFGRNNYGQLGIGTTSPFEWKSTELDLSSVLDSTIVQVECGSEHTLILTKSGSVWSFGWNEHGQLGLGDENDRCIPNRVYGLESEKIALIGAGYGFSFALS